MIHDKGKTSRRQSAEILPPIENGLGQPRCDPKHSKKSQVRGCNTGTSPAQWRQPEDFAALGPISLQDHPEKINTAMKPLVRSSRLRRHVTTQETRKTSRCQNADIVPPIESNPRGRWCAVEVQLKPANLRAAEVQLKPGSSRATEAQLKPANPRATEIQLKPANLRAADLRFEAGVVGVQRTAGRSSEERLPAAG